MTHQPFTRTFIAGKVPGHHYKTGTEMLLPLWITVEFKLSGGKHRLSITGVHGPMSNGEAHGSCGQCTDTLQALADGPEDRIAVHFPGHLTGRQTMQKLSEVWRDWHLNDMRAHCDHQLAIHKWDLGARLTIWKWKLNSQTAQAQSDIRKSAERQLLDGQAVQYTEAELELLKLPYWAYTHTDEAPSERYQADGVKTERACHLYPLENLKPGSLPGAENFHPRGLLTKPCPTCGHKWGSAWLHKEVPDDVLEFLAALPDQSASYPWSR